MSIRKIDKNFGEIPSWGDDDFDENVHQNFKDLKEIIPKINITTDDINVAINEMNILKNQAETVTLTAQNNANLAVQKASEASSSANQALIYKNQVMGYVVPSGASYSIDQINTQNSAMTKAQFNALSEERKANRAGSGFDSMGKHSVGYASVNDGIIAASANDYVDAFQMGWNFTSQLAGTSKTNYPIANINGVLLKLFSINRASTGYEINKIQLPTAPTIYPYDTVLTTEQINSGVIKHADSSNSGLVVMGKNLSGTTFNQTISVVNGKKYIIEYVDNAVRKTLEITASSTSYIINLSGTNITEVGMYPLDAISRSDLVFLESWHEDISEKNIVYPLGNVQYLGGNTDGLTGIANGSFSGFETYSLFGNWQTPSSLIGKGYVWSSLTEAQKKAFISNPDNNCYLDGDKVIQVRYRARVVQGLRDIDKNPFSWLGGYLGDTPFDTLSNIVVAKGKKVLIPSDYKTYANRLSEGTYSLNSSNSIQGIGLISDAASIIQGYSESNIAYEGKCFALPIALVHRRNQGMYHPVYNPNGTKKASDDKFWYDTTVAFTSISDCFNPTKLLTASGYIGSVSGRPDGLFYDQVHESDILDLRNSSKKPEDYNRLMTREFNKLVAGTNRGKESEIQIYSIQNRVLNYGAFASANNTKGYLIQNADVVGLPITLTTGEIQNYPIVMVVKTGADAGKILSTRAYFKSDSTYLIFGDNNILPSDLIRYTDGTIPSTLTGQTVDIYIAYKTTRTKSNTLLCCDIIGNPTNYPTSWKQSGAFGVPLIVAEDGTSLLPDGARDTFKLSRKANATPLLCLRSTDSGVTWTSFIPTFSTTTNAITLTDEPANNLVMVYYQTHTSMAVPTNSSEILSFGDITAINYNDKEQGAYLVNTLIGKIPVGTSAPTLLSKPLKTTSINPISKFFDSSYGFDAPTHETISFYNANTPAVKILPYLTRTNGKAYLNLVFKEMKYNGTSWGDDNKFNIVNNVSTTTDNNGQTVLIGQKKVELNVFIAGDE